MQHIQLTSRLANNTADATGLKQRHREKILNALIAMPEGGTFDEIAKATGMEYAAVGRRVNELVADSKVKDSGHKGKSPTGRAAIVWEVIPQQLTLLS